MRRILIVDDEPLNLELLTLQLEAGGYRVVACTNGREALDTLERERFDAVMLDITMPRPDGFETCRIIRATHADKRVPIVFLTGLPTATVAGPARAAGGDRLLGKPASLDQVLDCVARVLIRPTPSATAPKARPS